ncbi:tail fiber domain-containing protein [Bizionia sp.]|uniref:tail fiber domain-containing protein n=1 Tax=Flavobacteriaceae TaxID=49546 RepID=UPI003A8E839E
MKYIITLSFFISFSVYAQVGIGTTMPNAVLDIKSSNQALPENTDGLLIPKIDEFPSASPTNSQDGMIVFVTGLGTPPKGFYYWDNGNSNWIQVGNSQWIDSGTYLSPINGNTEDVTIGGANNPFAKLTVRSDKPINALITNTSVQNGPTYGVNTYLNNSSTNANSKTIGNFNDVFHQGAGALVGEYNKLSGTGTGNRYGVDNLLTGSGNGDQIGVRNLIDNDGSGSRTGVINDIQGTTNGRLQTGVLNVIDITSESTVGNHAFQRGVHNIMSGTFTGSAVGEQYGMVNEFSNPNTNAIRIGIVNQFTTQGNIDVGVSNIQHPDSNAFYGVYNVSSSTGSSTGPFVGCYNLVLGGHGGDGVGVMGEAPAQSNGSRHYAAWFSGRVRIGNTSYPIPGDGYILPQYTPLPPNAIGSVMTLTGTDPEGHYIATWESPGSGRYWNTLGNTGEDENTSFIGTIDNEGLSFRTNNYRRMFIDSNGHIGINNDTPLEELDVDGTIRVSVAANNGAILKSSYQYNHLSDNNLDFGGYLDSWMYASQEGTNETSGIFGNTDFVTIWAPGDQQRYLRILDEDAWGDNDGNPYNNNAEVGYIGTGGQYFQASDENRKKNIKKISNPLKKIKRISGYTYQYKQNDNKSTIDFNKTTSGVIAQELYKVFPEAVEISKNDEYFVHYAGIVPLLIEAIKEQEIKINYLENKLQSIEKRLQSLENK